MECQPRIIPVESLDDPRIACYCNLKDKELARLDGRFIAEGDLVTRRLLESGYQVESVLLAQEKVAEFAPLVTAHGANSEGEAAGPVRAGCRFHVYAAPHKVVNSIVGFRFHSGVMAVGRRRPPQPLEAITSGWQGGRCLPPCATIMVLPEITKTDNMGALLRIAAAFGVDAIVLGERCCDPFYRQSVRVSMGSIFKLSLHQSQDLASDLMRLKQLGVQIIGTVLDDGAEPLPSASRPGKVALLFGNEAQGLSAEHLALCDRRITIPMKLGTDSLNVAMAAAVFLYHFTTGRGGPD